MTTFNFTGRNAIVTGSARGLGAQFALDLGKAGANVLLTYTSPSSISKAETVMNEIRKINPNAIVGAVQADSGMVDVGEKILKAAVDLFARGEPSHLKIHILVHNAAISGFATLETETLQGINDMFNNNVRGTFLVTQALRPHIPNHDNARIIVISSIAARVCGSGQAIYNASKAALESFVRTWNNEFGIVQGITINAVNPGPVKSDMWDQCPEDWKKFVLGLMPLGDPSDISDVVLFLASKESRWVSGSVVSTNRGALNF